MSPRKIVVFGATGHQGSSVARALVADKKYEVVGITRNPDSAAAKEIAALGVTMAKGDMNDAGSVAPALKDAHGVFLVTDSYNGNNGDEAQRTEVRQGKAIVDAVAAAGIKHLVFSTLESYRPRQKLPHFDGKADITGYIRTLALPATQLFTSYYYSNVHAGFGPSIEKQADGSFVVRHPLPDDAVLPSYAVEQTGLWAKAAFDHPETWIGEDMVAAGENTTVADVAAHLRAVSGKTVVTEGHTREAFLAGPHPDEEMRLMWVAVLNGEFKRDVAASRKIVPDAWGFAEWAKQSQKMRDVLGF